MINQQPVEKYIHHSDHLEVHSMWRTIQGEGPFAGRPALFVRLGGCNLKCPLCDTDYTSQRTNYTTKELLAKIEGFRGDRCWSDLIVLTGGEPFRQNIAPFVCDALSLKYEVQIETNGILGTREAPKQATIVCSPKTPSVHPLIEKRAAAFKYILHADCVSDEDGLPTSSLGMVDPRGNPVAVSRPPAQFNRHHIYVQPVDVKDPVDNLRHRDKAVDVCLTHGYTLCLQIHKIIGLD